MTNNPHWHEQQLAYHTEPAMPEAPADRLEPPALQITMTDRPDTPPEKSKSHKDQVRDEGNGSRGVEEMLQRICDKIDENEKRYGDALDELNERLNKISQDPGPAAPAEEPSAEEPDLRLDQIESEIAAVPEPAASEGPEPERRDQQDTFEEIERRVMEFAEGTKPTTSAADHPVDFDSRFKDITAELEDSLAATPPVEESEPATPEFKQQQYAPGAQSVAFGTSDSEPDEPVAFPEETQDQPDPLAAPELSSDGLQSIEATLAELSGYFERAEAQFGRIDSIDEHLNRLADTMQAAVPQVERAARQAVQEVLQTFNQEGGLADASRRLDAIEANLNAINDRSEQLDARTFDALTAMNHTIAALTDQIAGKRPAMADQSLNYPAAPEAAVPPTADPAPAAAAPQVEPTIPHPHLDDVLPEPDNSPRPEAEYRPVSKPDNGYAEVRITRAGEPESPSTDDMSALGAELPDYQPLPQDRDDQPAQPVLQPAASPPEDTEQALNDANDFLAAARRAAQAAAHQQEEKPKSKSFLSRFRRKPKDKSSGTSIETKKTKPVLVFAALLLLAVSAVLLYGRLMNKPGGTMTGFFERNTAPTAQSRGKSASKLSQDRGSDRSGVGEDMPLMAPLLPMEERETFRPRRGKQDQLVTPQPAPSSPYLKQSPTAENGATAGKASRTRTAAVQRSATLPAAVRAQPATLTPRVLSKPKTAPIVKTAPHREDTTVPSAPPQKIALPPAAIGPMSLRSAAADGNAQAQFEVANRFAKGHGVTRNYEKALTWYRRAASKSFAPAQYMLAALYERGLGTKRDLAQAKIWYGRASSLGNVKAMHNLAVMHTGRDGNGADYLKAGEWFSKAAAHGLADSQFNLGILYENGLGVPKSMSEAYKWFALAANRGDEEAGKRRDLVKLQLDPAALSKAEKTVRDWRAAPTDKSANQNYKPEAAWAAPGPGASAQPKSSPLVAKAQKALNKLGYTAGPADGVIGPKTTAAIKEFQMRSGLDTTGLVSEELLSHLEALTG